jgi:hypothetical protein
MVDAVTPVEASGAAVWRHVATGVAEGALTVAAVARFAELVTPALAGHLLGNETVDTALGAGAVARSRLVNRFNAAAQRVALTTLYDAGFDLVVLKGFAFACTLYPEPEIRTIGDLDILVRPVDRDRLIGFLAARGYAFRPLPTPPWGFISTASYMPFVSADGAVNLDIHVQPDCYPAGLALTAECVFAAAQMVEAGGGLAFRAPCDTHALLLCATNAAKDKFGAFAARKIIDALLLLRRSAPDLVATESVAASARFHGPLRAFLALLRGLGAGLPERHDAGVLPVRMRAEFARMLADTQAFYPATPNLLATLRRELTICTEPSVGLHNALVRLTGLVRPGAGVPHGTAAS